MLYILIIGIVMAVISAIFWCLEALPFVRAQKELEPSKGPISGITYTFKTLGNMFKLMPLFIDLTATVWLAGSFGFGGMIGGVIGITISNVISVFILIMSRKKKKEKT